MMAQFCKQSPLGGLFGLFATVAAGCLAACGGGGGSDDFGPVLPGNLVYVDVVAGKDRLYISKADSSANREVVIGPITVLPPHEAGDSNLQPNQITSIGPPVWSPDGSQIAVTVSRAENQSQVIVVDADTGAAFTASPQTGDVVQREQTTNGYIRMRSLDWSPDGQYLSYLFRGASSATRRLMMTQVSTGEVEELLAESAELEILSHRWDESSAGLYVGAIRPDSDDLIHLDLATKSETTTGNFFGEDLTRTGGALYPIFDSEYTALGFVVDAEQSILVRAGYGRFYGWFLSLPNLIAVEEIGSSREPPLIARFDPTRSTINITWIDFFSVHAPVALKWDFYAPPEAIAQ